jgi:hypothetical protein
MRPFRHTNIIVLVKLFGNANAELRGAAVHAALLQWHLELMCADRSRAWASKPRQKLVPKLPKHFWY